MIGDQKETGRLTEQAPIRVLVVDDSLVCRELLSSLLCQSDKIQVVATASSGKEAITLNHKLKPDLITMDVDMPGMNGFIAIEEIMRSRPVPILVVTASPIHKGVDLTFQTLEVGALDITQKPEFEGSSADKLRSKVHLLAKVPVCRRNTKMRLRSARRSVGAGQQRRSIIAITSSTGGPRVLLKILSKLPMDYPFCILITQHLPEGFCAGFTDWLNSHSLLEVSEARNRDPIRPGKVLVAPSGCHLVLRSSRAVALSSDPPWNSHRPSGSLMYRSLAKVCGSDTVGLILSGMGSDGADGLLDLRQTGGICIAQDQNSSLVFGMPKAAIDLGAVEFVLDVEGIIDFLLKLGD